jgi:predicted ATP-dependent serine protease
MKTMFKCTACEEVKETKYMHKCELCYDYDNDEGIDNILTVGDVKMVLDKAEERLCKECWGIDD